MFNVHLFWNVDRNFKKEEEKESKEKRRDKKQSEAKKLKRQGKGLSGWSYSIF